MAVEWDKWRKEVAARKKDWIGAAQSSEYGEYLYRARKRFERGEAATFRQIKEIYRRAAASIRSDIENLTPGTLRHSHLNALAGTLEKAVKQVNTETLAAVQSGIRLAVDEATSGPEQVTMDLLDEVFDRPSIKWMFADINQRAVLSILSRTRHEGLKLSDRVWRISQNARKAITMLVEDGVVRGLDARTLAKEVQRYLQPDKWTALKAETRRRLGVPKNVSMEAMRLAVTEMQHAFHEGTINSYRAIPSAKGIYWRLSSSHPIPDVCDDYASHNSNGFWPKGQEPAKPHPWCRCVAIPAMEDPKEFTQRLKEWMKDPSSQPDIETWYNNTARRFLKRPSKSVFTGGFPEKANIIKGYILKGHEKRNVAVYQVDSVRIVVPTDLDKNLQKLSVDDIKKELRKVPDRLKKVVDEIQLLDYANPDDEYWEKEYGIKGFRSFATGGNRIIHFYANEYISVDQIKDYLPHALVHELGHCFDQYLAKALRGNVLYYSSTEEWTQAAVKDKNISGKGYVSWYAEQTEAWREDFADSIDKFIHDTNKFESLFPNRAKILRRELKP